MLRYFQIEKYLLGPSLLIASCQPTEPPHVKAIAQLPYLLSQTLSPIHDTVAFQVAGLSEQKSGYIDKWLRRNDRQFAVLMRQVADTAVVFPIIVGEFEAQQLAVAIEQMPTQRPLLPALLQTFITRTGYRLNYVIINRLENGIFYSTMYLHGPKGQLLTLDSRPIDAITLALLAQCPIYVLRSVARDGQQFYAPTE